jgi:GTPase SAR1 family protein
LQGRYRENWSFFYPDVDGIFFVVDSADKERLSIVQEILMEMSKHAVLRAREIPVIVLANK